MLGLFLFISFHSFFFSACVRVKKDFMVLCIYNIIGEQQTCFIRIYPFAWILAKEEKKDLRSTSRKYDLSRWEVILGEKKLLNVKQQQ